MLTRAVAPWQRAFCPIRAHHAPIASDFNALASQLALDDIAHPCLTFARHLRHG